MSEALLLPFGENIWTAEGGLVRMLSIPFYTRMTVIRLDNGQLWLHSPVEPTLSLCAAVDELGTVAHIVAPNKIHSLGVQPWKERYPDASTCVSPRFGDRHSKLVADVVLNEHAKPSWQTEIPYHLFAGSVFLDELVFFHPLSKTLIFTDLIQRHDPQRNSWFWRMIKGAAGILGEHGGMPKDLQLTFTDRAAARQSAGAILQWDFERVILSHGFCIEEKAHQYVKRAFAKWPGI